MLTVSVIFNLVLGVAAAFLLTERDKIPKRDASGRFKAKAKPKKRVVADPDPDWPSFFKDITGDSK